MDYWESGMHLALGTDLFDSFQRYQSSLIEEYRRLANEFGFIIVDARDPIDKVQSELRTHIADYLKDTGPNREQLSTSARENS
jgi:dTMP kinase